MLEYSTISLTSVINGSTSGDTSTDMLFLPPEDESADDWGEELSELTFQKIRELEAEMIRNWTLSRVDWHYDLLKLPVARVVYVTFYVIVIVVGLFSNSVVIIAAAKSKKSPTVTNLFVVNLALSDLGLCLFSLPIQLHYQLTDNWIFGEPLCRIVFSAFALPMYHSAVTIFMIAVDRYWLVVYPFRDRISVRTSLVLIAVNILLSLIMSSPVMYFSTISVINEPLMGLHKELCVERWPSKRVRLSYSIGTFLVQFCLPLLLTSALYFRIYSRLKSRTLPCAQQQQQQQLQLQQGTGVRRIARLSHPTAHRWSRTNKILVAIVANFVVCWLPWNVFSLVTEIDHRLVKGSHFKLVDLGLKWFAMGSVCVNPLLYCWLNENLRKDLSVIALRLKIHRRRTHDENSAVTGHRGLLLSRFDVQPPADHGHARDCGDQSMHELDMVTTTTSRSMRATSVSIELFSATNRCCQLNTIL